MSDTKPKYIAYISRVSQHAKGLRTTLSRLVRSEYTGLSVLAVALAPLALLYGNLIETTPLTVVVAFMVSSVAGALGLALIALRTWIERRDRLAATARSHRARAGRVAVTPSA